MVEYLALIVGIVWMAGWGPITVALYQVVSDFFEIESEGAGFVGLMAVVLVELLVFQELYFLMS